MIIYPSSVGKREFLATLLIIGTSLPIQRIKNIYTYTYVPVYTLKHIIYLLQVVLKQ